MDTGKILRIIEDIQRDESDFDFQARFRNVLNYFNEPNREALNSERVGIEEDLQDSILGTYVGTDYQALDRLSIENLVGLGSMERLNQILQSEPLEARALLEQFVAERENALGRLEALKNSLTSFGLTSRKLAEDEYELGFSLPEEYKDLDSLKKVIADINNFLNALSSSAGKPEPFRVSYVSNGSIELYIQTGIHLAHDFEIVVRHIADYYGQYKLFQAFMGNIGRFSPQRRKALEAHNKKQKEDDTNKVISQLVKELGIKGSDQKNRIKELFERLLNHLENNVMAEVRAPLLPEPEEPPADASQEQNKAYQEKLKQYEMNRSIEEANQQLYLLQSNDFDGASIKAIDGPTTDN